MRFGGLLLSFLLVAIGCSTGGRLVAEAEAGSGGAEAAGAEASTAESLGTRAISASPTTGASSTMATTSSDSSTTLPTTSEPPRRKPITIGVAGDTSFTNGLHEKDPFAQVGGLLSSPDLMVVNLETAVADPDVGRAPVAKPFLFKSPPSSLQLLVEAGVDVVGLANNHTLDFGPDALAQTLAEVDAAGLHRVGAGIDQDGAYTPLVVPVGEWSVGVVSLSRVPCDWSASGENVRPQVAWACPPFIALADAMVEATMANADLTIVMVHGGEEGVLCPSSFMTDLEQHWADLGVDVVIDGHPHVVQGITSLPNAAGGETMVAHSTGNFAFPSANGVTANSAVFLVDLSEEGVRLRVEPVRASGGVLTVPTPEQRQAILDQINSVSAGWLVSPSGSVEPAPDHSGSC